MGNYQAFLIGLLGLIQKKKKLLSFIVTISLLKRKKKEIVMDLLSKMKLIFNH